METIYDYIDQNITHPSPIKITTFDPAHMSSKTTSFGKQENIGHMKMKHVHYKRADPKTSREKGSKLRTYTQV